MDQRYFELVQHLEGKLQVTESDLSSKDSDVVDGEVEELPRQIILPPIPPLFLPEYPPPERFANLNRAMNSRQG